MPGGRCLGTLATPGGCPGVQTQGEKRCGPFVLGVRPLASAPPPQEAGVLSGPEDTEASCTQTWSPGITSGAPSFPTPHLLPVPSQPDALGAGGRNPEMHVQLFFSPFPTPGPCKAGSASFFSFLNLRLASLSPGLYLPAEITPQPHTFVVLLLLEKSSPVEMRGVHGKGRWRKQPGSHRRQDPPGWGPRPNVCTYPSPVWGQFQPGFHWGAPEATSAGAIAPLSCGVGCFPPFYCFSNLSQRKEP